MIVSADEFARLRASDKPDEYARAAHEEAVEGVWLEVINRYPELRAWVAHNKTVPLDVLQMLATDRDPQVRAAVAAKRKLSADLFAALAADPDERVRQRIACNAKVPLRILEQLSNDRVQIVADAARERLAD